MVVSTMGSDYWPKTSEGRIVCLFLALYAFAVFGYVAATIASFFVGKENEEKNQEFLCQRDLLEEFKRLNEKVDSLTAQLSHDKNMKKSD